MKILIEEKKNILLVRAYEEVPDMPNLVKTISIPAQYLPNLVDWAFDQYPHTEHKPIRINRHEGYLSIPESEASKYHKFEWEPSSTILDEYMACHSN